jgi:hypothetical protein
LAGSTTSQGTAGPAGRLQQGPDGLGLPAAGRPAHEDVPVKRLHREPQRAGRHPLPVEHLAQGNRGGAAGGPGAAGRRSRRGGGVGGLQASECCLGRDIEVGAERQPDSRYLRLGGAAEGRQQRSAGVEGGQQVGLCIRGGGPADRARIRLARRRAVLAGAAATRAVLAGAVLARAVLTSGRSRGFRCGPAEQVAQRARPGLGRSERVRQSAEIGGRADEGRHPGRGGWIGAPRQQVDVPHAAGAPQPELGVPVP